LVLKCARCTRTAAGHAGRLCATPRQFVPAAGHEHKTATRVPAPSLIAPPSIPWINLLRLPRRPTNRAPGLRDCLQAHPALRYGRARGGPSRAAEAVSPVATGLSCEVTACACNTSRRVVFTRALAERGPEGRYSWPAGMRIGHHARHGGCAEWRPASSEDWIFRLRVRGAV
jgi:hypothetical protein